jgi:hypothetical protein
MSADTDLSREKTSILVETLDAIPIAVDKRTVGQRGRG